MFDLQKIEEICHEALQLESPEREEFLNQKCGDDEKLRSEIESLLAFEEQVMDFIETPPADIAADLFSEQSESRKIIGKTLNNYRVLSLLGAGGMGEVYLAEDSKLQRKVALKIIPPQFFNSKERKMRFLREARAVSALNHPNIITVYGIEDSENIEFIATEYIEGKTLGEKISENTLNWKVTLDIAIQIAGALESAHDVGIVHRDIKPANIMIRTDNIVKVLDFGLAKLTTDSEAFQTLDQTAPNRVMGTINYMSPEQALGEEIDARTDIFSFGVVLYEMLSGIQPFQGESEGAIYNQTINKNPPSLSEFKPEIPLEFERIVRRAMSKDKAKRFQTASEMRLELEKLKENSVSYASDSKSFYRTTASKKSSFLLPFAIAFSAIAVSFIAYYLFSADVSKEKPLNISNLNFTQATFQKGEELFPSLSPDGKTLIYASQTSGNWDIYSQRVGGTNPLNITKDSISDDTQPVVSPDGEQIAFRSERDGGGIFLIGATGENPKRLSDFGYNPSWSPDGKEIAVALEGITFSHTRTLDKSTLWAINAETGEKRMVADFDAVQPNWSPNRKLIAFWTVDGKGKRDIQVVDAKGGTPKSITNDAAVDWNPIWSADGKFLYFASDRGGSMNFWRVPINDETGEVTGEFQSITVPTNEGQHFSFSRDGKKITYVQNQTRSTIRHIEFDAIKESVIGQPTDLIQATQLSVHPAISPNGEQIVFSSAGATVEDIFIINKDGSGMRKLTDDKAKDRLPRWSPDGKQITYYSNRNGKYEIWRIEPDGSNHKMLTEAPNIPTIRYGVWSPDGKNMAYVSGDDGVAMIDTSEPFKNQTPYLLPPIDKQTIFEVWSWSPDGKYLTGVGQDSDGSHIGIYSYSIENKTYKKLNEKGSNPIWLSDNRRMLFNFDDKIFLLDTNTGKSREVLASSGNNISQFEISTDNKKIYFGIELLEADVWIANFE